MQVEYMSFSAHADAKGIMQLVGQAEPESVLLVHGEAKKMEFLKQKIEQEFRRQPRHGVGLGRYRECGVYPWVSMGRARWSRLRLSAPPTLAQGSTATCQPTVRR